MRGEWWEGRGGKGRGKGMVGWELRRGVEGGEGKGVGGRKMVGEGKAEGEGREGVKGTGRLRHCF